MGLVVVALASSIGLLASDARIVVLRLSPAAVSALPLLTVGLSFLVFQAMIHPRRTELLKNIVLAGTFLLWGVVQLMGQNLLSKRLGDVVIALYVLDLAWTILAGVTPAQK